MIVYERWGVTVHHGDCLDVLRADVLGYDYRLGYHPPAIPDASIEAICTDPPYGLAEHRVTDITAAVTAWTCGDREFVPRRRGGFMGREWDSFVPPPAVWDECLRVLKPGGHLLCFAGTRTVDLMGLSIRLAGFEIRDEITTWLYGQGFPKSQDVSKAIDATILHGGANSRRIKQANDGRDAVGEKVYGGGHLASRVSQSARNNGVMGESVRRNPTLHNETAPATDAARQWSGWHTALKPAHEPILVARKPLQGTVAANVLEHGTGGLNIDACRVDRALGDVSGWQTAPGFKANNGIMNSTGERRERSPETGGRWPANVVLVHSPDCDGQCAPGCPVAELDQQSGSTNSRASAGRQTPKRGTAALGDFAGTDAIAGHNDSGGASRFFPVFRWEEKAPTRERPMVGGRSHPTVKPVDLMRWLVRLVTPPGGTVLDCFAGSGATLQAARAEGCTAIGIESEPSRPGADDYIGMIRARLDARPRQERSAAASSPVDEPTDLLDLLAGEAS